MVAMADNCRCRVAFVVSCEAIQSETTRKLKTSLLFSSHHTAGGNCYGSIIDNGYNTSSDNNTCPFSNTDSGNNVDPLLAPLADNGGPIQTMALQLGSPAIDAGSCVEAADQRGVAHPQGVTCDIGAYEY